MRKWRECAQPDFLDVPNVTGGLLDHRIGGQTTLYTQNVLDLAKHDDEAGCRGEAAQHGVWNEIEEKSWG